MKNPILLVCLLLLLVGCGGGGGDDGSEELPVTTGTNSDGVVLGDDATGPTSDDASATEDSQLQRELAWLYDKMKTEYLWYDETPDLNFQSFTSADDLLQAMIIKPRDRFSYITSAERNTASQTATSVTYGLKLLAKIYPFKVMRVYRGSSADRAGMTRADVVTRIGNIDIVDLASAQAAWDLFNEQVADRALEFEFVREGLDAPMVATLTAAEVSRQTVDSTLTRTGSDGNGMGYLSIYEFRNTTADELRNAFATFRDKNVQTLVIDLRDNGGGRIDNIAVLGSLILGSEHVSKPFIDFRYSDLGEAIFSNENFRTGYNLQIEDNAVPMREVHIISSNLTCSASEMLINSLRSYIPVGVSGVTTCGKPHGFYSRKFEDKSVLFAINFQADNADGEGGWFNGIEPTCEVQDYEIYPYGDRRDRHLGSAIEFLESGTCSVSTTLAQGTNQRSTSSTSLPTAFSNPVWQIQPEVDLLR